MSRLALALAILLAAATASAHLGGGGNDGILEHFPAGGGGFTGPVCMAADTPIGIGGTGPLCTDVAYWWDYDATGTRATFNTTDGDGGGTDDVIWDTQDGTNDVRFSGGVSTDDEAAPTSGLVVGGNQFILNGNGLTVGHTAQLTIGGVVYELEVVGTVAADSGLLVSMSSTTDADHSTVNLHKSGNGTPGSNTILADGESVGALVGHGDDGVDTEDIAEFRMFVDDPTPASNAMGGRGQVGTSSVGGTMTPAALWDSLQNQTWKPTTTNDVLITTGGGDIPFLASIVTGPITGFLDAGIVPILDMGVSSASADGERHGWRVGVNSTDIFEMSAESDGAEGVDKRRTIVFGDNGYKKTCGVQAITTLTFAADPGDANKETAANFIPRGSTDIAVVGTVLVAGTNCASIDVGDGTDHDLYGAALTLTVGTVFGPDDYTAAMSYNAFMDEKVRITGNVVTNCFDLSVRIQAYFCTHTAPPN